MSQKPSKTDQQILRAVKSALKSGKRVTVDGLCISGIRFHEGEIEVNWPGLDEPMWTVIQPWFLNTEDEVEIKTF